MRRQRSSATTTEDTPSTCNMNADMANTSSSKLEIFLDTTITGISLFIAFSVYIYLFAIAALVCLVPREYYASLVSASYGNSGNKNIDKGVLPLIEMIFPHSNSQFLRGSETGLQPQQQQHRSTSLGNTSEIGSTDSKSATANDSDGAADASPPKKTTDHSGHYDNEIVEKSNFAPSQQLRDALYSWFTDQDHQALGENAGVHFFNNDHSYTSRSESESEYTLSDENDLDLNNANHIDNDGRASAPHFPSIVK